MLNFKRAIARAVSASVLLMSLTATSIPASAGQTFLNAGFESGYDGFAARATESVDRVDTKAYEGSYSLLISNRTEAWNGAVTTLGTDFSAGQSYSFSCAVYQESGSPVAMKLSLQYKDADNKDTYVQVATDTVSSGEWTVLSNTDYLIPSDASDALC